MYEEFFLNLDKEIFYKYYKTFSNKNLYNILNNSKNIIDYLEMDINYILRLYDNLNKDVKSKIIKNINVNNLLNLYKHDKITKKEILDNVKIYDDINFTIQKLDEINLLFLFNDMKNINFKIQISKIYFYNIKRLYPYIKTNSVKFKILINGIDELFLNNLLNYFDKNSLFFLKLNYNHIFKFNQISEFSNKSIDEINNMNVNKLKIILLIGTSNEYKIKKHILEKDNNFIKNIINLVDMSTFLYVMKNIKICSFYDLFEVLELAKIKILLPHLNINVLSRIFIKFNVIELNNLVESLSLNQFIECLNFISDEKLECLKNMNSEHKLFIESLLNNIDENLYHLYFPFFSRQIIFCILNTSKKKIILDNIKNINFEIVKSIIRHLNVIEIMSILNKFNNIKKKIEIIDFISKDKYSSIKDYIENDLLNDISTNIIINYKLIHLYIDLDLNEVSDKKLKNMLNLKNI